MNNRTNNTRVISDKELTERQVIKKVAMGVIATIGTLSFVIGFSVVGTIFRSVL